MASTAAVAKTIQGFIDLFSIPFIVAALAPDRHRATPHINTSVFFDAPAF
jgi:hypothetical protein